MRTARTLTDEERCLIAHLWDMGTLDNILPPTLLVEDMDDGGMGGLSFVSDKDDRWFGGVAGSCEFNDDDGVLVQASLVLDRDGNLFELDMWKIDFSPLIRILCAAAFRPIRT